MSRLRPIVAAAFVTAACGLSGCPICWPLGGHPAPCSDEGGDDDSTEPGPPLVTVCWDGAGDFETLQSGVDAVADGGSVQLCVGGPFDGGLRLAGSKTVTIVGHGPGASKLVAAPDAHVLEISAGATLHLREVGVDRISAEVPAITISQATLTAEGAILVGEGAAAIIADGALIDILDTTLAASGPAEQGALVRLHDSEFHCTASLLTGGTATGSGGGVYSDGSDLTFDRCTLSTNEAPDGAGIHLTGGSTQNWSRESCSLHQTYSTSGLVVHGG